MSHVIILPSASAIKFNNISFMSLSVPALDTYLCKNRQRGRETREKIFHLLAHSQVAIMAGAEPIPRQKRVLLLGHPHGHKDPGT